MSSTQSTLSTVEQDVASALPVVASVAEAVGGSVNAHQTALTTAKAANSALASSLSAVLPTLPASQSKSISGWLSILESCIGIGLDLAGKL